MAIHNENSNKDSSKRPNEKEYATCAIYTCKTAGFGNKKEISDNESQRLKCETIINMDYKLVVSSKRYDDADVDEKAIDEKPALQELFSDIEVGLVNTVVAHTLYTFSTSFNGIDEVLKIFKRHDVRIILAWHGIDSATLEGRRFFLNLSEFIQMESFSEEKKYLKNQCEEK